MHMKAPAAIRQAYCVAAVIIFLMPAVPDRSVGADKLRISYSGITVSNAMLWVTREAKLFQKNGLDVELLYLQTTLGQNALIAGEVQLGVFSGSLMSAARIQGADNVMVVSFLNHPIYRLVVRPGINSVEDLRGKRLGITRFGTVTDWNTRLLLSKLGLNPDKDVTIVQVGDVPILAAALVAGKSVDGAILQTPYYQKAVAAGLKILANMEEMNIPLQQTGIVTTERYIAKSPDMVRRVVKSVVEGIHFMRNHPEASKRTLGKYMQIRDEKELEEPYEALRGFIQIKPYPSPEGFKTILTELSKRSPAVKNADPKDFVDIRFLEELDRSGFIDGLYR